MKFLIQLMMKLGLNNFMAKQLSKPNGFLGSRLIGRMMNNGNAHLESLAVKCANINPNNHVLEIGFGNGKLLKQLCSTVTNGKVYGVDISEDLIKQVSARMRHQIESGQLQLHLAGVSNIPLPDSSIDCIITCNTIYFWPEPLKDAKELVRILKPGGKLICGYRDAKEMANYGFVTENSDIFKNRYTDQQVKQLFLNAGFPQVSIKVEQTDLAPSHVATAIK